jgi:hypothetical protein
MRRPHIMRTWPVGIMSTPRTMLRKRPRRMSSITEVARARRRANSRRAGRQPSSALFLRLGRLRTSAYVAAGRVGFQHGKRFLATGLRAWPDHFTYSLTYRAGELRGPFGNSLQGYLAAFALSIWIHRKFPVNFYWPNSLLHLFLSARLAGSMQVTGRMIRSGTSCR